MKSISCISPRSKIKHALKALLLHANPGPNFSRCAEGFQEKPGGTGSAGGAPCWAPGATGAAGSADEPQQPPQIDRTARRRCAPPSANLPRDLGGTSGSVGGRGRAAKPGAGGETRLGPLPRGAANPFRPRTATKRARPATAAENRTAESAGSTGRRKALTCGAVKHRGAALTRRGAPANPAATEPLPPRHLSTGTRRRHFRLRRRGPAAPARKNQSAAVIER